MSKNKVKKVKIKMSFEIDVEDWYEYERLTRKETLEKLEEDFSDIEVLVNHMPTSGYDLKVKEIK